MFWTIVAFAVVFFVAKSLIENIGSSSYSTSKSSSFSPNVQNSKYEYMPTDAHEQVEALAQLISFVYQAAPYAKNDFAKGNLYIFREDSGGYKLKFWYDWDYSCAKSIIEEKYALGSGFSFNGDDWVNYETTRIDNVTSWCKNSVTNSFYLDPVIATLQNNCPGLQIIERHVYDYGLHVAFTVR